MRRLWREPDPLVFIPHEVSCTIDHPVIDTLPQPEDRYRLLRLGFGFPPPFLQVALPDRELLPINRPQAYREQGRSRPACKHLTHHLKPQTSPRGVDPVVDPEGSCQGMQPAPWGRCRKVPPVLCGRRDRCPVAPPSQGPLDPSQRSDEAGVSRHACDRKATQVVGVISTILRKLVFVCAPYRPMIPPLPYAVGYPIHFATVASSMTRRLRRLSQTGFQQRPHVRLCCILEQL